METTLLTSSECSEYIPRAALIAFTNSNQDQNDCYLEMREIRRDGTFGPAKGVSRNFIQNILSGFSQEYRSIPHGQIPGNLLYADTRKGKETYIWYNPPGKRNRYFSESLNLEDGQYHVPGTLYVAINDTLKVFCFEGKKPNPDKVLLGVPYFNIYADGRVCMGSAKVNIPDKPNLTYQDIMDAWENAFWNSRDVHTNGSPSTRDNLLDTISKYKNKPFNTKELTVRPDNLTINRIISKLN